MAFLFIPATIWALESEVCMLARSPRPHPCLPYTHLKDFAVLISPSDKEHGCSFTWFHSLISELYSWPLLFCWLCEIGCLSNNYFCTCIFMQLSSSSPVVKAHTLQNNQNCKNSLCRLPKQTTGEYFTFFFCHQHSMFISLTAAKP